MMMIKMMVMRLEIILNVDDEDNDDDCGDDD